MDSPDDSPDPDIDLILRAYRAFAAGDIAAAVADLHPDVEWIEPDTFPHGGRHQGAAAVAAYLTASYETWSHLVSEPTAYRRGADIVVVHHVRGTLRDGTPHEATVADVFTVAGGQVVRMRAYASPAELPGA